MSCSECCGALEYYDKAFDRITTRNEKQLKSIKRIFHTVTTTDDPVIRKVPVDPTLSVNCPLVWFSPLLNDRGLAVVLPAG